MPVMDGYTAIKIIKSDEVLKSIPVIVLSASGMKEQKDNMEILADDFLIKPIYKNELLSMLMKYLTYEELAIPEAPQVIQLKEKKNIKNTKSISPKIKNEMIFLFMASISKQLESLNVDEAIDLVEKIVEYNEKKTNC